MTFDLSLSEKAAHRSLHPAGSAALPNYHLGCPELANLRKP